MLYLFCYPPTGVFPQVKIWVDMAGQWQNISIYIYKRGQMMVNMSKYGRFLAEIRVPTKVRFIYTENDQHIIFVLPNESLFFSVHGPETYRSSVVPALPQPPVLASCSPVTTPPALGNFAFRPSDLISGCRNELWGYHSSMEIYRNLWRWYFSPLHYIFFDLLVAHRSLFLHSAQQLRNGQTNGHGQIVALQHVR